MPNGQASATASETSGDRVRLRRMRSWSTGRRKVDEAASKLGMRKALAYDARVIYR